MWCVEWVWLPMLLLRLLEAEPGVGIPNLAWPSPSSEVPNELSSPSLEVPGGACCPTFFSPSSEAPRGACCPTFFSPSSETPGGACCPTFSSPSSEVPGGACPTFSSPMGLPPLVPLLPVVV